MKNRREEPAKQIASFTLFEKDPPLLRVNDLAARWLVSAQHIINLLEEGKLNGFDIAGRHDYMRVPSAAIDSIANKLKVPREVILKIIRETKPARLTGRASWRICVEEGAKTFMQENHSTVLSR